MNKQWSQGSAKPVKLNAEAKSGVEEIVKSFIAESAELKEIVNRFEVKTGRIYLYRLHEQFGWDDTDMKFIEPLIDGKYNEFPMARITLFDVRGDDCAADYQRHTGQWINLYEGDVNECLTFIEDNNQRFQ